MARFLFALLLLTAGMLQAALAPMGPVDVRPDFALVLLLVWSAGHGTEEGLFWAFGLGIWLDFLTLDPLGTHAIPLLIVAVIGGAVRGRLFRSGAILPVLAVVGATVGSHFIRLVIDALRGESILVLAEFRLAFVMALMNALVVPLVYLALLLIERWTPARVS